MDVLPSGPFSVSNEKKLLKLYYVLDDINYSYHYNCD